MSTYSAVTEKIEIQVVPNYSVEQSSPTTSRFMFTYHITVINNSSKTYPLLSRYWIIRDGLKNEEEVQGPGVVGEQPIIAPGERFEYTSFCPLPTPTGSMRGHYVLKSEKGRTIKAAIPLFFLRVH